MPRGTPGYSSGDETMFVFDSRRSGTSRLGRRPPHTRMRLERLEDRTAPTVVPLGSEFQVNTYTTNDQSFPSVAMNQAGDFAVAWSGDGAATHRASSRNATAAPACPRAA